MNRGRHCTVIIFDEEFKAVFFPQGLGTYRGAKPNEVIGLAPWDVAAPDYAERIQNAFAKCLSLKESNFHVGKLKDEWGDYPGQKVCVWLDPIKDGLGCPVNRCCAAIMCRIFYVPQHLENLTDREWEVLSLLSDGLDTTEIAKRLFIEPTTVHTHLWRTREKLQLDDSLQVAVWASRYSEVLKVGPELIRG